MYGDNYGYRTGLNQSMVNHVKDVATYFLPGIVPLAPGDVVVDIGSNDGTLLTAMPARCARIGVDPTIPKFSEFYTEDIVKIPQFFPSSALRAELGDRRPKVITSIAMFYDTNEPLAFAREVYNLLHPQGTWFLELAYLPLIVENTAFDVICHEHACYYGLRQLKRVADATGFHIHNLWLNDTNGGSIAVALTPNCRQGAAASYMVSKLIAAEAQVNLNRFSALSMARLHELRVLLVKLKKDKAHVVGLGASTKGNILLHAASIGPDLVSVIGDVNPTKWGRVTSTGIPIVPEEKAMGTHYLVLPWHFRSHFLDRHLDKNLIFPLPNVEVVRA